MATTYPTPTPNKIKGSVQSLGQAYAQALSAIENVRDYTKDFHLQLPQICVVGDQSSGKSSLLESISGVPFPEGSGIVTKCPIVVRTRQAPAEEWFVDDDRVESKSHVSERIRQAQEKRLNTVNVLSMDVESPHGQGHGGSQSQALKVSSDEIRVTYLSPDNVDLVVVDLPGIIHHGEGVDQVDEMIRSYLASEMTLIMVVREADRDPETLKALQLSNEYDPAGERQLQVLTKFDSFSSDENLQRALKELSNRSTSKIPPHGVCCRKGGQRYTASKEELETFRQHSQLATLNFDYIGVEALRGERLTSMLAKLILLNLPKLRLAVANRKSVIREELLRIGEYPVQGQMLLDRVRDVFAESKLPMLKTALSRSADELSKKIGSTNDVINEEDVCDHFSLHYYEAPIFQGAECFDFFLKKIIAKWDELRHQVIAQVDAVVSKIIDFEEIRSAHVDLSRKMKEKWGLLKLELMQNFAEKTRFYLDKEKDFGTMDAHFTTNYETDMVLDPHQTIEPFKEQLINSLLAFREQEFKDGREESAIIKITTAKQKAKRTAKNLADQLCKRLKTLHELSRQDYLRGSLETQQAKRIFAALKAYEKIIRKTYLDNYIKAQRDAVLTPIQVWMRDTMTRDAELLALAKEAPSTTEKRKRLKQEITAMSKSFAELDKL